MNKKCRTNSPLYLSMWLIHYTQGFPQWGGMGVPPPPHPPHTHTHTLKNEASFQKLETVINNCVSLIKQHWKKMTVIPQKRNFLNQSIQNFVRKVKEFVTKYSITWLVELANKLYDIETFLDFILCHVLSKNCLALLRNFANKPVK